MWESKVRPYQHKQVLQFGTKFDLGNPSEIYSANFSTHTNEIKHFKVNVFNVNLISERIESYAKSGRDF